MKILHTEASDAWGGQEIRILSEAIWFRKNGHEIVLCMDLKFPSSRIASIPTGINTPNPLPEREASRNMLIDKTNAPPDTQWIGQVSVLRSWKGHDILIRAFDILAEKNPQLRLAIAGGGPGYQ